MREKFVILIDRRTKLPITVIHTTLDRLEETIAEAKKWYSETTADVHIVDGFLNVNKFKYDHENLT